MNEDAEVKESNVVAAQGGAEQQEPVLETRIRIRAYELYEQRQGADGDAQDDWFRAEAEVRGQAAQAAK